jgi:hypothetical protein
MGTYCVISGDAGIYDENDEAANLYVSLKEENYRS